jgi:hypothetical protein
MLSLCLFPIPSHLFFAALERHRAGTIAFFGILAACGARSFLLLLADRLRGAS